MYQKHAFKVDVKSLSDSGLVARVSLNSSKAHNIVANISNVFDMTDKNSEI